MNHSLRSSSTTSTRNRRYAIALAIACGVLVTVPACMPPLRPPEPGAVLPADDPAASQENSAQVRVEDFFDDPTLISLIDQALCNNWELKILAEDVQIANNEVLSRSGAYLPFLGLAAGLGLEKFSKFTLPGAGIQDDPYRQAGPGQPAKFLPNPLPNFLLGGPQLSWQVDIWNQLHNAQDAASRRYLGTIDGRTYVVTRLVAEVAENYYTLMALDKRLENLDLAIALQEHSLRVARSLFQAARTTEVAVQRFQAEVRKNQSEKSIVIQDIIQTENRINFLLGRYPQPVPRQSAQFFDLTLHSLSVGVPSQLLQNRPDIRQAERDMEAAGLDVKVARKRFYPAVVITGGVGYQSFNPSYLMITPEALIGNIAGGLVAPFINRRAIKADYLSANDRQLETVYNYQRVVLNAFTEVINRVSMVENYRRSIEIKKQQLQSLDAAVRAVNSLFQNARVDYMDVLFAQRDLIDARRVLIDTKREQLSAVVNAYQALGGGGYLWQMSNFEPAKLQRTLRSGGLHPDKPKVMGPVPPPPPAVMGPVPPPTPATAVIGPVPPPTAAPVPPPTPPTERGPIPPPTPPEERGPIPPPTPPAAERAPEPIPIPEAERGPEPIPAPMGGGEGSGTNSNADAPPG
jgi:outer membrane protein, multidrug efflux system